MEVKLNGSNIALDMVNSSLSVNIDGHNTRINSQGGSLRVSVTGSNNKLINSGNLTHVVVNGINGFNNNINANIPEGSNIAHKSAVKDVAVNSSIMKEEVR